MPFPSHPAAGLCLLASTAVIALGITPPARAESPEARRTLVATASLDQAPYATADSEGQPIGHDVDLIRAVAHAAGMDVSFLSTAAPSESESAADVVLGATYRDGGQPGIARYCEPHSVRDHAVFVRDTSLYRNLRDLAGRALVVPGDARALPWLESHGFGADLVRAPSTAAALQLFADGHGEALVCDRYQGLAALPSGGLSEFRLLPDSILPAGHGFALTRSDAALADAINAALAVVRNTGQAERLRAKWLTHLDPPPQGASFGAAYSLILWLVIPGILLVVATSLNALSLRKRANLRIQALEAELAESRQSLQDLAADHARKRYVINQLSAVSLVDQIAKASRH